VKPATPHPFEGDTVDVYGAEHCDIRWPDEWKTREGWRPYNPSLAWVNGRLFCSIRYSFFAFPGIDTTGQVLVSSNYYGRSETLLAELDPDTLQVVDWRRLEYLNWSGSRNTALEDVRLYVVDGTLYGIGVYLPLDDAPYAQAVIRIDPAASTATLVDVLPARRVEKNWSPVEGRSEFIYSPTETVDYTGTVAGDPYKGAIHGGTQLIEFEDGYLSLVHHSVSRPLRTRGVRNRGRERHYVHHWALWNRDLRLTHLTAPFVFKWEAGIEFASGLVRHNDRLLISWGWGDWDLTITAADPNQIGKRLKPYPNERDFLIRR